MSNSLPSNAVYMFKHLHNAIEELVTGSEEIRTRLIYAGEHYTCIAITAVPKHLQPLAQEIRDYLTEHKAKPGAHFPYDSDISVTMRRRRKTTAVVIAKKMWSLYFQYEDAIAVHRTGQIKAPKNKA